MCMRLSRRTRTHIRFLKNLHNRTRQNACVVRVVFSFLHRTWGHKTFVSSFQHPPIPRLPSPPPPRTERVVFHSVSPSPNLPPTLLSHPCLSFSELPKYLHLFQNKRRVGLTAPCIAQRNNAKNTEVKYKKTTQRCLVVVFFVCRSPPPLGYAADATRIQ